MPPRLRLTSRLLEQGAMEGTLRCEAGELEAGFRLAFSLLSPAKTVEGCEIAESLGGYHELRPADGRGLAEGGQWAFRFAYEYDRHAPLNVSWGPEGAFVIDSGGGAIGVASEEMEFPCPGPLPDKSSRYERIPAERELGLAPSPRSLSLGEGRLQPNPRFQIAGEGQLQDEIGAVDALAERTGLRGFASGMGEVELGIKQGEAVAGKDSYRLEIGADRVALRCGGEGGLRHGLISLLQLRALHPQGIPCCAIEDSPRFGWRGMHLDCARHFYSVATVKRFLDLLALLKMNRLHWHPIDDEAFRLELPSFPQLAELTAWRGPGRMLPPVFGAGLGEGGVYSWADVAEVLAHARALGIEVMPEIEWPAHCLALLRALPGLRDPDDRSGARSVQGYPDNVVNPALPATWEFLRAALPEIAEQFDCGLIHLGGDEVPDGAWSASPALDSWRAEKGLADRAAVFEWTMREAGRLVAGLGGGWRPAAWADAAKGPTGGMGSDALLFAWSDQDSGAYAAEAGYEVVMCPAQHTYMDMAPDGHPLRRGLRWAALVSLADTVGWEPAPAERPAMADRVVGVQGGMWSETVRVDQELEPMIAPRILGVAESAWADAGSKASPARLHAIERAWRPLFGAMGWQAAACA